MATKMDYSTEEWPASAGHFPLTACTREELLLLHRHWMWANQQREAMERTFGTDGAPGEPGPLMMASVGIGFMLCWYGMLWTVIEACTVERSLDLRGAFRAEIDEIGPRLKRCRNAVMHVPKSNALLDDRIADLVAKVSATAIRRVHRGFARMFSEEMKRRTAQNLVTQTLADASPG